MKANTGFILYAKVVLFIINAALPFASTAQSADETAIRQLLADQTRAWNSGNIDAFMHGYWQSDSLMFIGKKGPQYGYNTTLENYKKGYPDTTSMGKLHFDLLQLKKLSWEYYFVLGKWDLQRTIGNLGGYFTLLFRKIKNRWVIICDHTS
jgi:ketosteroid isomerase-like protein